MCAQTAGSEVNPLSNSPIITVHVTDNSGLKITGFRMSGTPKNGDGKPIL